MNNKKYLKTVLFAFSGIILFNILFYFIQLLGHEKISCDLSVVITIIPLYLFFLWLLISISFNYIFKNPILSELKTNAFIISIFFLLIILMPFYLKFYDKLSLINTLILGNIYIPFYGYVRIDMTKYFLISITGSLWLIIIFIFAVRVIINFYNKIEIVPENFRKKFIFIFSFIFYLLTTSYVTFVYPPTGDEPHYITTAISIAKDFDFDLTNNYENKEYYFKFYPEYINDYKKLHTIKNTKNNGHYSTHNIGLPLLISPLVITNGRYWLQFFMNFISALLILIIYIFLKQMQISDKNAIGTVLISSICMPIIAHSSIVLTEIPATLLISYSIYFLIIDKNNLSKQIIFFVSIGLLPWLHSKFIIISLTFFILYYFITIKKNKFILKNELINIIPVLVSLLLYVFYYYSIYNIIFPFEINKIHEKVYTSDLNLQVNKFEINLSHFFISFLAIFFDRDFGLITYCPLYIISFWGMLLAISKKAKQFLIPLIISLPYLILFLLWKDWTGSMTPSRQIIPIVPLFILFAAYFIDSINIIKSKLFKFLLIISLFFAWLTTSFPLLRYAMSKDKIYSFISTIIPKWTLLIIPSFRENVFIASIISFTFIIIILYFYFFILKNKNKYL